MHIESGRIDNDHVSLQLMCDIDMQELRDLKRQELEEV